MFSKIHVVLVKLSVLVVLLALKHCKNNSSSDNFFFIVMCVLLVTLQSNCTPYKSLHMPCLQAESVEFVQSLGDCGNFIVCCTILISLHLCIMLIENRLLLLENIKG